MENGAGAGDDEYTRDGSVDLRGNPVLRSKRGGWKACSFIVVYELFERMAYYGIASNLVIYLTEKLHQGTVEAANNVTNWSGTVFITPLIGAVVADAWLGRYWTFVAGSAVYLMGMLLLTLAVSVPALKPPPCDGGGGAACPRASALQLGVYFGGLYTIALGHGGTKPNISTIGADQFDDFHPPEKLHKLSFFNWWMFTIFLGILFSTTVLVYLQDNVSWTVGYGIPTLGLMVSVAVFLSGTPLYRHKVPQGSPLATMGRVVAAAVWKWRVPLPADSKELHELELEHYTTRRGFRMDATVSMAFLNKAAVKPGEGGGGSVARLPGWTLCTVTQVEETKQIVKLVPLLATMVVPCTLVAQAGTLFVKQGVTLDRRIGKFHVPPASLGAFVTATMLICIVLYDRFLVPAVRRRTKNPRGITLLQRISLGMLLQIVTMVVTSVVESQRLGYARRHGLVATGGQLPVTIFILLPQFVLLGVADAFLVVGQIEFFYDQAPESMKSLGTAMSLTAYGAGNLLSSAILAAVERVTGGGKGRTPWVTNNLNASRLDYYYAFLATLAAANLLAFVVLSCKYSYRVESTETIDVDVAMDNVAQGGGVVTVKSEAAPMA
ncbi:protein NRT1/ PTR FAMILY 5.2 [Oryza sativa Japonica Group]|uniref:Os10g0469900 protein n=2 Tax=Oryza sativa subsp. japonica TaxID=39947 RepID=A0A5S6RAN6_ORYSJ|nr:protein NRT1/ PTR FAMILY 5.2 [Oryza sativa Japonica Group]AAG21906.1 putative peptide transport protein [Oryza sativa Japonica Group]AAP54220.1 POT family protein, expressed [Oryza sativa Japonica Group]BAF26735.1 Os10g0469900 [Oryza sativa Japonica Group]BAT11245.1 Os10g0469900 [Oryza sativa Japonica Group]|eukprot:NP_001064821.1 Os10g0469900 [Oryza sativa Japonica Group]